MPPRRPVRLVDWFPPAFIAVVGALPPGNSVAARLFAVALAAPLLARRRRPLAVFGLLAAIALAQVLVGARSFGDAALLVALYTVAVTQPRERLIAALVVTEVGIVLGVARWAGMRWPEGLAALNAMAIAATVTGINLRARRALVESLRDRAARLELERDQQGQLAAAAERARIAREMHDIVAHNLSVMIALADGAGFAMSDAPERAEAAMRDVSRTGRQALKEMRRLLGILRDGSGSDAVLAPQPGIGDLEALLDQVRGAGLPVTLAVEGSLAGREALPEGLQLTAYRIVQEALTNTLKHGGSGVSAQVSIRIAEGMLGIEVRDSGQGGSADPAGPGGGLRGMRERAAVYGGQVEAGPLPDGGGWRVATTLTALAGVPS
jgi:signal transduction histidine kinase